MKRCTILTCAQKLTNSQLNLPHGTKQKRVKKSNEETKNKKNRDDKKKRLSHKVVESVLGRKGVYGWNDL